MARQRIGSMEVDLTLMTGGFVRGVERVQTAARGLGNKLRDISNKSIELNKTTLLAAAAYGYSAKRLFELGAAVEETQSKFDTVFGSSGGSVQQAINQFASLAGLSQQAAQEVTATSGAIVQGFGLSERASAALSVEVTRLAGDLASFNNVPVAETARAIQAGLTGEMEALKRLGIAVLDADVKQKALAMTGKTLVSELSNQEIVMARFALITERAGVQVGDMVRTQDTAAATARVLVADLKTLRDEIASALLPALAFVVEKVVAFIKGLQILGAEAAVLIAQFNFWAAAAFATEEELIALNDEVRRTRIAAMEVKDEIIGLNTATGEFTDTAQNMATVLEEVSNRTTGLSVSKRELTVSTGELDVEVVNLAGDLTALAAATGLAADETDRLRESQQRLSAIRQGLGFLSFIPGVGQIANLAGTVAVGIGAASSIRGAFGGPPAASQTSMPREEVVFNFPPARSPTDAARDPQIARMFAEQILHAREMGVRFA